MPRTDVSHGQQRMTPGCQRPQRDAAQECRRQKARQRKRVRMLAQQPDAAAAVARHLAEQAGQRGPRMVTHADARREEAAQAGAGGAVVELHVFAGVERLVEQAHFLEHRTAIGDGHALRRHEALAVGVDVRAGMVAQTRRPRRRHGPLERRRAVTSSDCGRPRQSAPLRANADAASARCHGSSRRQCPSTNSTMSPREARTATLRPALDSRPALSSRRTCGKRRA